MEGAAKPPDPARFRRTAEHSSFDFVHAVCGSAGLAGVRDRSRRVQHFSFQRFSFTKSPLFHRNPPFPASGLATGFFKGLHARRKLLPIKKANLWNQEMLDQLKHFDGELDSIDDIPQAIKDKHKTVFGVDYPYIIDAAARRQKWIDQSQSVNLFLASPDMKVLSHMYRRAWDKGLKTTYYLRTLQANNIEKATIDVKKEQRGHMATQTATTAATNLAAATAKREFTDDQKMACSIDAMLNGGECQACQ